MTSTINSPPPLDVEAGKIYACCQCGLSAGLLCDNSHRGHSEKKAFKFIAKASTTLYLCVCPETQAPPFYDGGQHCDKVV